MRPSIDYGERMMFSAVNGDVGRGDIIMFKYPKDNQKHYVKRVIGHPGETIEIKEGIVPIDGVELSEPYVDQEYNKLQVTFPPRTIPAEHYFVMGDNRDNSSDSRYWGTVDLELVVGKYYFSY
jgi:signal peptidase I